MHNVTASQPVRAKILLVWSKVVKIIDKDAFQPIAKRLRISSLLGPLLLSSQDEIVVQAMSLVEALMEKLPDVFTTAFVEEGVVHAIAHLASPETESELTGDYIRQGAHPQEQHGNEHEPSTVSDERRDAMARAQAFIQIHFAGFSAHQDTDGVLRVKSITEKLTNPNLAQTALVDLLRIANEDTGAVISL